MKNSRSGPDLDAIPAMSFLSLITLLLASAAGAIAALILLPAALPGLSQSLLGPEPKAFWYLARSSAWVAYGLLWLSMVLGLMITTKAARLWPGGPAAYDIHQFVSLLAMAVAMFHGLILTGDRYIGFSLVQVFIPFSNPAYRPFWVGLGQIGFYSLAIVGLSFYVRRKLTPRVWRLIHYLSFLSFLFVLIHGIASGTDSAQPWAVLLYWFTGGSVLFLTMYRIALAVPEPAPAPAAIPAPTASASPWRQKKSGWF
jgi:predicted ferric reductase